MEFKYQFASKRVFDKLYKTHNLIENYQSVIGSEEYEQIVQNLMYIHDRLQKLYKYYDHISNNLNEELKQPFLYIGNEINNNPIEKDNFILNSHQSNLIYR